MTWQGPWSASTAYNAYDAVQLNGSSYIATAASTNTPPPGSAWNLVAQGQGAGAFKSFVFNNVSLSVSGVTNLAAMGFTLPAAGNVWVSSTRWCFFQAVAGRQFVELTISDVSANVNAPQESWALLDSTNPGASNYLTFSLQRLLTGLNAGANTLYTVGKVPEGSKPVTCGGTTTVHYSPNLLP